MSQRADISGIAGDDLRYNLALTYAGAVLDLAGLTVTAVVKARNTAADDTGTTYTTADGLTVTDAAAGAVTWDIPHADTATPGNSWYRVYVTDGAGRIGTALCGTLGLAAA